MKRKKNGQSRGAPATSCASSTISEGGHHFAPFDPATVGYLSPPQSPPTTFFIRHSFKNIKITDGV